MLQNHVASIMSQTHQHDLHTMYLGCAQISISYISSQPLDQLYHTQHPVLFVVINKL